MSDDERNDRNEKYLRTLAESVAASNSSAERMAQILYTVAHGGLGKLRKAKTDMDEGIKGLDWIMGEPGDDWAKA